MRSYQFKMYDTMIPTATKVLHYEVTGDKNMQELLDNFLMFLKSCDFQIANMQQLKLVSCGDDEIT